MIVVSTNLRRNGTSASEEERFGRNNVTALTTKTKRLNVNLPEPVFNELDKIAKESGRTMTDVVRIALGLVAVALSEEKVGHKLAVMEPNGTVLKELVLPK